MHVNARSLKKPKGSLYLSIDLHQLDIDICLVVETWLNEDVDSSYVSIEGYHILRHDRTRSSSTKHHGGGVACYHRTNINAEVIEHLTRPDLEVLWIKSDGPTGVSFYCIAYYPPDINKAEQYTDCITSSFETLLSHYPKARFFISGDFNDLDIGFIKSLGLHSLNKSATYKSKQLDYIFTSHPGLYKDTVTLLTTIPTDHKAIVCHPLERLKSETVYRHYRDQRRHRVECFNLALDNYDFKDVYQCTKPNEAATMLTKCLVELLDEHCPLRKVKMTTKDPAHISPLVKQLLREKYRACRSGRTGTVKKLNEQIGILVVKNIQNKHSRGTAKWWSIVNNVRKPKVTLASGLIDASTLNKHYANISTSRNTKALEREYTTNDIPDFTLRQVYTSLKRIKKTASGDDGVPHWVYSANAHAIADPVLHVFNICMRSGHFPDTYKRAKVTPVPKVKNPTSADDYRPISITPVIARVFERLIYDNYLKDHYHKTLNREQYGFRSNSSTDCALLRLVNTCQKHNDDGAEMSTVVSIDLSKAFDRVLHSNIIARLRKLNFNRWIVNLIISFLENREQYVVFDGQTSTVLSTNCGIPQGTVNGPPLFNIEYDTLSISSPQVTPVKFADDANLIHPRPSGVSAIDVLAEVRHWCDQNNMLLNESKTKILNVSHKRTPAIPNEEPAVKVMKVLGVHVDNCLTFSVHVEKLCKNVSRNIYLLYRLKSLGYDKSDIQHLYQSLVMPLLEYCCTVWGAATDTALRKIDSLQRKAVRMGLLTTFKSIFDILAEADNKLLVKIKNPAHLLHDILPERTIYAQHNLRERNPGPVPTRREKYMRTFPNRALRNYKI